jgi:hypothetical protein
MPALSAAGTRRRNTGDDEHRGMAPAAPDPRTPEATRETRHTSHSRLWLFDFLADKTMWLMTWL